MERTIYIGLRRQWDMCYVNLDLYISGVALCGGWGEGVPRR